YDTGCGRPYPLTDGLLSLGFILLTFCFGRIGVGILWASDGSKLCSWSVRWPWFQWGCGSMNGLAQGVLSRSFVGRAGWRCHLVSALGCRMSGPRGWRQWSALWGGLG